MKLCAWGSGLTLLLAGCGLSPFERQVQSAQQAEQRGDLVAAVTSWDAACALEPKDTRSCARAKMLSAKVSDGALQRGAAPCQQGRLDACVDALADARRVRPDDPNVRALLRDGMTAHRTQCIALERAESMQSTLERFRCVADKALLVGHADYDSMVVEERDHAALLFLRAAESKTETGASFVLARSARCLAPRIEPGRAAELETRFLAGAAQPIALRVKNVGAAPIAAETLSPCEAVTRALGPRARCSADGLTLTPDLSVDVTLSLEPTQHVAQREARSVRYQAGVRTTPNPDYRRAELEALRAQRSFDEIEPATHDRELRCQRTRHPADCDAYNAAVPVYNRRLRERDAARAQLAQTPATLSQPVFANASYVVTRHVWSAPYAIVAKTLGGKVVRFSGTLTQRDDENPSVPEANIAVDPLNPPAPDAFQVALRKVVVQELTGLLAAGFRQLAARCGSATWNLDYAEVLDCRARAALYERGEAPMPTEWLGSATLCK